jgi:hypothetical protein
MEFAEVLSDVERFADPVIAEPARAASWDPVARAWLPAVERRTR